MDIDRCSLGGYLILCDHSMFIKSNRNLPLSVDNGSHYLDLMRDGARYSSGMGERQTATNHHRNAVSIQYLGCWVFVTVTNTINISNSSLLIWDACRQLNWSGLIIILTVVDKV